MGHQQSPNYIKKLKKRHNKLKAHIKNDIATHSEILELVDIRNKLGYKGDLFSRGTNNSIRVQ